MILERLTPSLRNNIVYSSAYVFITRLLNAVLVLFLARFASATDFGKIAAFLIYSEFILVIINLGFNQLLIQRQKLTKAEVDSVFTLHVLVTILMLVGLLIFWGPVSEFSSNLDPKLLPAICMYMIFSALNLVPEALLRRDSRFSILLISSIVSFIVSASVSIYMLSLGNPLNALVAQLLTSKTIIVACNYYYLDKKPFFRTRLMIDRSLFRSSKFLFVESIIDTSFRNLIPVIIAWQISIEALGLFFFASKIADALIPSLLSAIQQGSLPVFSHLTKQVDSLKISFLLVLRNSLLFLSPLVFGSIFLSEFYYDLFFGQEWAKSFWIFQILSLIYLLLPFHVQNTNLWLALGRTDFLFWTGLLKRGFFIISIIVSSEHGLEGLLFAQLLSSVFALCVHLIATKLLIDLRVTDQVTCGLSYIFCSVVIAMSLWVPIHYFSEQSSVIPIISPFVAICVYIFTVNVVIPKVR